jgi:hypothetical protein
MHLYVCMYVCVERELYISSEFGGMSAIMHMCVFVNYLYVYMYIYIIIYMHMFAQLYVCMHV